MRKVLDTTQKPDANLAELLATRARQSSDGALAGAAVGGLVVAAAVAVWRGPFWYVLVAAAVCCFSFGCWGIADRELAERTHARRSVRLGLQGIRGAAMLVGFAAAAFIMLVALGIALGRIIS